MPWRVIKTMTGVWRRQERRFRIQGLPECQWRFAPVLPMVLYTGRRPWPELPPLADLMNLAEPLERYVPVWDTVFVDLHRLTPQALIETGTALGWALRAMQEVEAPTDRLALLIEQAMAGLGKLPLAWIIWDSDLMRLPLDDVCL